MFSWRANGDYDDAGRGLLRLLARHLAESGLALMRARLQPHVTITEVSTFLLSLALLALVSALISARDAVSSRAEGTSLIRLGPF